MLAKAGGKISEFIGCTDHILLHKKSWKYPCVQIKQVNICGDDLVLDSLIQKFYNGHQGGQLSVLRFESVFYFMNHRHLLYLRSWRCFCGNYRLSHHCFC